MTLAHLSTLPLTRFSRTAATRSRSLAVSDVFLRRSRRSCRVHYEAGEDSCVDSVNEILNLLAHADAKNTDEVVRAVVETGGAKSAAAIVAWCDFNTDAAPFVDAVRHAVAKYDDRVGELEPTANVVSRPRKKIDPMDLWFGLGVGALGVPMSTYFPVDLQ